MNIPLFRSRWTHALAYAVFCVALLFAIWEFYKVSLGTCRSDWYEPGINAVGTDFGLRLNEVYAVNSGINPFDIYSCRVTHPKYYPNHRTDLRTSERNEAINAYPPWAYTFLEPLAFIDRDMAWLIFRYVSLASLLLIVVYAYYVGSRRYQGPFPGIVCAASILLAGIPWEGTLCSGNYPAILAGVMFLLAYSLNHNRRVLAGLCWAVLMVKPQMALLFAIPLLVRKEFKVIIIAMTVCIVAMLLPALLTSTSPVDMIFQAPKASSICFAGCPLFPSPLIHLVSSFCSFGVQIAFVVAMLAGILICIATTYKLRNETNWFVFLVPTVITSVCWTYSWIHGWLVCALVLFVLSLDLLACKTTANGMFLIVTMLLTAQVYQVVVLYVALIPFGDGVQPLLRDFSDVASFVAFVMVISWCWHRNEALNL